MFLCIMYVIIRKLKHVIGIYMLCFFMFYVTTEVVDSYGIIKPIIY